jgi:WD40 repeat protein
VVSFFQSSRYVCTGSGGGQLLLWELRTRDVARSFRGHERRVNCLAFSHNEAQLASASGAGGGVLLHSTLSGQESTRLPQAGTVSALAFSRFRLAWLAAADEDGSVLLWDANTRTPAATFARLHAAPASAVAFSPSARLLLACAGLDARLHLLDLALKRPLRSLALEAPVHSLAFSEDGHLLAAGLANGTARPHRRRILAHSPRAGHIALLDLRKSADAPHSFPAHPSHVVACLRFFAAGPSAAVVKVPPVLPLALIPHLAECERDRPPREPPVTRPS